MAFRILHLIAVVAASQLLGGTSLGFCFSTPSVSSRLHHADSSQRCSVSSEKYCEPEIPETPQRFCSEQRLLERKLQSLQRRRFVSSLAFSTIGINVLCAPESSCASEQTAVAATTPQKQEESSRRRIIRLSSGLQFSDARVGSGPQVTLAKETPASKPSSPEATDSGLNNDGVAGNENDPGVVLMHIRALKRDGSTLLDTREDGRPLLFRLGSIRAEELYYINEGSALSKGVIPLGVQDAILAQGSASWEGGYGKADPMRLGGLRMVVVPPELAYGSRGVSRYEAYKLGLKAPVARNELLRYEIELFRCNDNELELGSGKADTANESTQIAAAAAPRARVCCLDEFYPCQTPKS